MMIDTRLFTGLSLPPEVLRTFDELLGELEPLARIQWSPISQLHITTKFIGTWPFQRVSELTRFLAQAPQSAKFSLSLKGLRYFKMPLAGWVLYARVEPCEELSQLAAAMDDHMSVFGIRRNYQEYLPHVTIGKVLGNNPWPELDDRVDAYVEIPLGEFDVTEYHIYESAPSGYKRIVSVPLA